MSFQISQEDYQNFLNQALTQDQSQQSEEEQRDALIQQGSEMVEQAKQSALDAGASLLPLGTIELAKSVGALYEKGSKAFKAAQLLKKQSDAKTARVETLKQEAYDNAVADARAKGNLIPDKETFFKDIDTTLREKQFSSAIDTAKTAIANKINPIVDEVTNRVTNTIEALGATADNGLNRLQTATQDTINTVADNFNQFKGVASKYQERYTQNFNKFKDATQAEIETASGKITNRADKVFGEFKDAQGNVAPELKAHFDAINDLVATKTPQGIVQADAMLANVSDTIKASKGAGLITNLKSRLDEAVAKKSQKISDLSEAHNAKLDSLTADKQALQSKLDNLSATRPVEAQIGGLEDLGSSIRVYRGAGFAPVIVRPAEQMGKLQRQIDAKSQAIQDEITSHTANIQGVEEAHLSNVNELQNQIRNTTDRVSQLAGEQTESILAKAKSAYTSVREGITAVKSAISPVTDVIGTVLAPVAIFQGATSAEALVKGEGITNATNDAQNLIGVKFGFDAAKGLTQQAVTKVSGLISGQKEAAQEALQTAEKTTAKEVEETATKQGAEQFAKRGGQIAGEDIAETLGKEAAEKIGEEGAVAGIGSAIPVVGEVLDAGLALFSVIDGIKNLFDKPKAPPPPPSVTQAVQFTQQRGVY